MHALQAEFANHAGETAWEERLRGLFGAGALDAVEAELLPLVEALDSEVSRLCLAASRDAVRLSGWAEMAEIIAAVPGPPVTGLTLAVGNELDLAFEKGNLHAPWMAMGVYTDEAWGWSAANRDVLLEQCSGESPAWAGHDEDVEVWLEITGLNALNTALIHHKQRHLIREPGRSVDVPLRYVEFVIGCWWRALRFHQAVADALAGEALPGRIAVVAGMVDMRPGVVSVHLPPAPAKAAKRRTKKNPVPVLDGTAWDAPDMAAKGLIQRKPFEEEKPLTGSDLRRRIAANDEVVAEEPPKRGLLARLFGRK